MGNQVVNWQDGQIIVRPGLVEDEIAASIISRAVGATFPDGTSGLFNIFGLLCSQTVSSAGLSFHPEMVRDGGLDVKRSGYDAFVKLPKALRIKWQEAIETADDVKDYALGPDPLPANAPKNS